MGTNDFIDCWCSRYDVSNYDIIIETWLKESDLQTLRNNTRLGAVGTLYKIMGRPHMYDKSWTASNTIKFEPVAGTQLSNMRSTRVAFPKNITTSPIEGSNGWIAVKIEASVSGQGNL